MILILLAVSVFAIGLGVTKIVIPSIIQVCQSKNLFDEPDERKKHGRSVPTLGGIGIFSGILIGTSIIYFFNYSVESFYSIIIGLVAFLMVGIKDDLLEVSFVRKFIVQFTVAFVIVASGLQIDHLYGLFGVYALPAVVSIPLTVLFVVGFINAFNFIDGIDGLAGGIGLLVSLVFAGLFFIAGDYGYMVISLALAGSLLGFLTFNYNPARIFMGDTGSLTIGFTIAVLSIKLINTTGNSTYFIFSGKSSLVVMLGLVALPVADSLRVFGQRILNGKSPFHPDRIHIHHLILQLGFGAKGAAWTIYGICALGITITIAFSQFHPLNGLYAVSLFYVIVYLAINVMLSKALPIQTIKNFGERLSLQFSSTSQLALGFARKAYSITASLLLSVPAMISISLTYLIKI